MLSLKACVCLLVLYRTRTVMCVIIHAIKETVVLSSACTHKYVYSTFCTVPKMFQCTLPPRVGCQALCCFPFYQFIFSILFCYCSSYVESGVQQKVKGFFVFYMFCDATSIAFRVATLICSVGNSRTLSKSKETMLTFARCSITLFFTTGQGLTD